MHSGKQSYSAVGLWTSKNSNRQLLPQRNNCNCGPKAAMRSPPVAMRIMSCQSTHNRDAGIKGFLANLHRSTKNGLFLIAG